MSIADMNSTGGWRAYYPALPDTSLTSVLYMSANAKNNHADKIFCPATSGPYRPLIKKVCVFFLRVAFKVCPPRYFNQGGLHLDLHPVQEASLCITRFYQ